MALSKNQIRHLRTLCHALNPVILVGQKGITESLLEETENTLQHHELIKIKLSGDRDERAQMGEQILAHTGAEEVQKIGRILCIFRRNKNNPRVVLPRD